MILGMEPEKGGINGELWKGCSIYGSSMRNTASVDILPSLQKVITHFANENSKHIQQCFKVYLSRILILFFYSNHFPCSRRT